MSPSVILRPPPLPLLNLPVLPTSTSIAPGIDGASSRRSRRAGLMSMPALPRQGSSRGAAGHEEFDDVEEDEDEDEDDGDGGGDDDDDDDDDAKFVVCLICICVVQCMLSCTRKMEVPTGTSTSRRSQCNYDRSEGVV